MNRREVHQIRTVYSQWKYQKTLQQKNIVSSSNNYYSPNIFRAFILTPYKTGNYIIILKRTGVVYTIKYDNDLYNWLYTIHSVRHLFQMSTTRFVYFRQIVLTTTTTTIWREPNVENRRVIPMLYTYMGCGLHLSP